MSTPVPLPVTRRQRRRRPLLARTAGVALAALLGALVPAAAQADSQPVISNVTFNPPGVGSGGGTVNVSALIESPDGIASASVLIHFATGTDGGGAMAPSGSDIWGVDVTIPPNNNDFAVTHEVEITAIDNNGNSQLLLAGSIAQDAAATGDQPPTVEVTQVSPEFLPVGGGDVRIQATAHDDHAISQVYAVVTGPDGPTTVPMTLFSPSDYEGFITIPANTEPNVVGYTVVAHVFDDAGQEGTDDGPSIVVDPNVPELETPVISNVVINPSQVGPEGGTVTISATITSSVGIAEAGFTVNLFSGGQAGGAMTRTAPGSDVWSGDVAIPANFSNDPINHGVDMSATGNDGGSVLEIVGSIDQEGQPQFDQAPNVGINSVTPTDLGSDGGDVLFSVSADDDHSVSEVFVTVTGPEGSTTINLAGVSSLNWEGTFTAPANTSRTAPVTYTTQATALDDAGQSAFTDGPAITVAPVPNQEPVVSNPSVTPVSLPPAGGDVTIRADATDPDGSVVEVHADITHPDGSVTSLTMTQPSVDEPYEVAWTAPVNNDTDTPKEHVVTVVAVDNDGAPGSAEAGSVTVEGPPPFDEVPDVFDTLLTPTTLAATGGQVSIEASATDDRAVSEVYAVVTAPDGTTTQVPMDGLSSSRYQGDLTLPANTRFSPASYSVEVTALDDIGQPGTESAGSVKVAARVDQAPELTRVAIVPATLVGSGLARLRATATDDRAVAEVYALVRAPGGAQTRVDMFAPPADPRYEGLFSAPENTSGNPVTYAVEIVATDRAGHQSRADAGALTVLPVRTPATRLRLSTGVLRFGRVPVGDRAVRVLTLRNPGAPGTGPIVVDVSVLGGRFELTGTSAGLDRVRLRPGRSVEILVAFAPRRVGPRTGRLLLDRTDGEQPGLSVDLIGRGVR